ncbi:hypothetical protein [Phreatobacter stygius]|uniref:Uncharacterized protein n=1 Tax=Phreatobacter stygius TaxID=1940610 RepID=A0A4D7B6B1_9HYPH|nr:hypothetical protein [Phreatobacter stygius]QCI68541.1 hypothetical protein E8M01_32515 [Phreatobacter stygius]
MSNAETHNRDGSALARSGGGGLRATLDRCGALIRLDGLDLPGGFKRISSLSGGAITAITTDQAPPPARPRPRRSLSQSIDTDSEGQS